MNMEEEMGDQGAFGNAEPGYSAKPEPEVSGVPASIPSAVRIAEIKFGSVTLKVYHLDDGRRVIDEQSIASFLAGLEDGTILLSETDADALAAAIRH